MGIRFQCPNGHALHVKDHLAGKRGICPHCGAKFRIPDATVQPEASGATPATGGSPLRAAAGPSGVPAAGRTAANRPGQPSASVAPSAQPQPTGGQPGGAPQPAPSVQATGAGPTAPQPAGAAAASGEDPIAAAPHALWYVRPPAGGQYGPAPGDALRTWIAEGRVPRQALVWREGWDDWRSAADIFAGLPEAGEQPSSAEPLAIDVQAADLQQRMRRKRSSQRIIWMVAILAIACVALLLVLIYVLWAGVHLPMPS